MFRISLRVKDSGTVVFGLELELGLGLGFD